MTTPASDETVELSESVEQTERIAMALAARLRGGECMALHGELGAGKTQFVRGIVRGLGGNPRAVSSPTFVLLNVYAAAAARLAVYHLDAYRVHGAGDFESIGFAELLEQDRAIVVVEWAERVRDLLPHDRTIDVHIEPLGELQRQISITMPEPLTGGPP